MDKDDEIDKQYRRDIAYAIFFAIMGVLWGLSKILSAIY